VRDRILVWTTAADSRCLDKASSRAKVRLQFSQMNGLMPMCSCICRLQSCCRAKPVNGIASVAAQMQIHPAAHTLVTSFKSAFVRPFLVVRPNVSLQIELPRASIACQLKHMCTSGREDYSPRKSTITTRHWTFEKSITCSSASRRHFCRRSSDFGPRDLVT
jgi:hypothetical protein